MAQKQCVESSESKTAAKLASQKESSRPQPRDMFQVVILCEGEEQQERLYDEFRARNLQVRLLTM